ncbi:MAG TPA: hypothetical protein VF161_13915 [Steroidobacteraceae bacterium]
MTAHLHTPSSAASSAAIGRAEHISIEGDSEPIEAPSRPVRRKIRSAYVLRSALRGCETELAILEEHFLSVRTVRPHEPARSYEIDLRFANPRPVRVRHISWFWLILSVALASLAGSALWFLGVQRTSWSILLTAALTLLASIGAFFMFLRRTTESLEFRSAHGEVTLVSVTGGIGSARAGKRFFIELIKNINAAKVARPQPRQQFLRDEMREHYRLRELEVLTEQQYEQGKARILAAH